MADAWRHTPAAMLDVRHIATRSTGLTSRSYRSDRSALLGVTLLGGLPSTPPPPMATLLLALGGLSSAPPSLAGLEGGGSNAGCVAGHRAGEGGRRLDGDRIWRRGVRHFVAGGGASRPVLHRGRLGASSRTSHPQGTGAARNRQPVGELRERASTGGIVGSRFDGRYRMTAL